MHIFIISIGFALWFLAYESKPKNNDEITLIWEEEKFIKRSKILNIMNNSFN